MIDYQKEVLEGKIVRKKKREVHLVMNVLQPDHDKTVEVRIVRELAMEYLQVHAVIRAYGRWSTADEAILFNTRDGKSFFLAEDIQLVSCASTPAAVEHAINQIREGTLPISVLPEETTMKQLDLIVSMPHGRKRRTAVGNIIRLLEGRRERKVARMRDPFVRQHEKETLERLEIMGREASGDEYCSGSWTLREPTKSLITYEKIRENAPLNVPGDGSMVSMHGTLTREEYITRKKIPQIMWLVNRIKALPRKDGLRHVLDVGGGRGDLATQIARTFPDLNVTVVDMNKSSLEAGEDYASEMGVRDRMHFVHSDFAAYVENYNVDPEKNQIDLVVALHACGDLSDLAIAFAQQLQCDFLVCPCCYTKRYIESFTPAYHSILKTDDRELICRFAETDDLPDLSQRSMTLINSMRIHTVQDYDVSFEEFDKHISGRNQVLVGTKS